MSPNVHHEYDTIVVGAGPAGACAAKALASSGVHVLIIDARARVGVPVRCAEYVPAFITRHVPLDKAHIAQRVEHMETFFPSGEVVRSRFPGYVLHRHLFDSSLVASAVEAGAKILLGTKVVELDGNTLIACTGGASIHKFNARIVIGADGPLSRVGRAIGQRNPRYVAAAQVEVVLDGPIECTRVYFDPEYTGGYGWVFPKGATANVGVGIEVALRGRKVSGPAGSGLHAGTAGGPPSSSPRRLLHRFMQKLGIDDRSVVSRTGGLIPVGGPLRAVKGHVLLAGDAAGHAHPLTGAGILHAVIAGEAAGRAAARAILTGDLGALCEYEQECEDAFGWALARALERRNLMMARWSFDPEALTALLRKTWIAFAPKRPAK